MKKTNENEVQDLKDTVAKLKKQFGITLVALVITMIVMLIIAGIVVAQLTGSGLFDSVRIAKEKYKDAQDREDSILSDYENASLNGVVSTRDAQNPVGTVISCIRSTAPEGYLACDGAEYNISDYPALAEEINKVYNGYNTETANKFKVPDLRGEFLRGTGTNGHTNQGSGGQKAGIHQDATKITIAGTDSSNNSTLPYYGAFDKDTILPDYEYTSSINGRWQGLSNTWNDTRNSMFATRPTNTSVLYCIKY